jgi:hypothetical protein
VVAIALALLPVVAVLVTRVGSNYLAMADEANIDLRVRDVFTSSTPLVGAYSRGFSHPGPLFFWLLAPLSHLVGGAPWATLVGGALLHGVAIALVGWLAYRRGGLVLLVLALGALGLAYSALSSDIVFLQTWNPNVAFPFFLLFLLQVWALATGARWQLVGACVVGTFLVQLHVGYLPVVLVGLAWGIAVAVFGRAAPAAADGSADPERAPPWRRVVVASGGALVLLWAAPVIEQLTHDPGNLGELMKYFRDPGEPAVGLVKGAGLFAAEFKFPPPWWGGGDTRAFATGVVATESLLWLLVPAALLALGCFAVRRRGRLADRRMLELAAVMAVAAIVAMARITVDLQPFLFYWRIIVALFLVIAVVNAVIRWLGWDRRPTVRPVLIGAGIVVIALSFGGHARAILDRQGDLQPMESITRALAARIDADDDANTPVLVRGIAPTTNGFVQGLFDALDRDGRAVRVDERFGYQYGDRRTAAPSKVREIWYVSADGRFRTLLTQLPGARLVGYESVLPPALDHELIGLQRSMARRLAAEGHPDLIDALDNPFFRVLVDEAGAEVDIRAAQRISDLNQLVAKSGGCRCTIVGFPVDRAPDLPFTMGF